MLATSVLALGGTTWAHAQDRGLFGGVFGGSDNDRAPQARRAEETELVTRLGRIEEQMRQLTGSIEQLQYRNQQLEQQIRRMQEDNEYRFQQLGGGHGSSAPRPSASQPGHRSDAAEPQDSRSRPPERHAGAYETQPYSGGQQPAQANLANAQPPYSGDQDGRRDATREEPAAPSDAFDPSAHPEAPGAPHALGGGRLASADPHSGVGMRGGRAAGAPLDLSAVRPGGSDAGGYGARPSAGGGYGEMNPLPPPPAQNPSATGQQVATLPPSGSPKDQLALGVGYVEHKDYARAERALNGFLKRFPDNALAPDARYWLGESLFQRQRYRDAAEEFLTVTTKYDTSGKAPNALMRLGQALNALGEKETACAAWGEVKRKYPRASVSVRQNVARELKRAHC